MTRGAGPLQAATEAAGVEHGEAAVQKGIIDREEEVAVTADLHAGGSMSTSLVMHDRLNHPHASHTSLALLPTRPEAPQAGQAGDRCLPQLLSRVPL